MSIQLTQFRKYIQQKWENAQCHCCGDVRILQLLGSQQNAICPALKSISICGAVNHRNCRVVAYRFEAVNHRQCSVVVYRFKAVNRRQCSVVVYRFEAVSRRHWSVVA